MVWYSHLFQNFPQLIVIHIVKGFGIVNTAEIDVFLKLSSFFHDPADVGNLISGSSAFSKLYRKLNSKLGSLYPTTGHYLGCSEGHPATFMLTSTHSKKDKKIKDLHDDLL